MQQTLGSFLLKILQKNDFLRIRFEDMNTEEEADAIIGNDFIYLKMLPKLLVTNSTFTK
jgi:hypothetical protein